MSELMASLWLSLFIAAGATAGVILLTVPLAYFLTHRRVRGQGIFEAILLMPLVLPPTVVGYLILMLAGRGGWVGGWLYDAVGYSITFRYEGAILAAAVVALPMMYLSAKAAFASIDREFEDMGRVLGGSSGQIFWNVSIPIAARGLLAGAVLTFARALGEFGATAMVFGWQPGRMTLPISIYADYERGEMHRSAPAVVLLSLIAFGLIAAFHYFAISRPKR